LVNDVIGLLDALGVERAHVVGHDWGSAVAWAVAAFFPQRIASLTAISVGHPALYARPTIAQRERSWYMLFFQFEGVAETLLTRHDWALFRELMRDQGDTERAIELLSRPGALTAALSVYRANVPPAAQLVEGPLVPPVSVPTMGIWSDGDVFLLEDAVAGSGAMVQGAPFRYERVTGVGHFIPVDAPEKLNPLLLDFLKSTPAQ
ncbi:MAG TPA: alpha/beta fold hydrolase, partial [Polyangiaceae bacterium]|nr:alpha/beta fold hydrolase [Polyangiaceae bacterium]